MPRDLALSSELRDFWFSRTIVWKTPGEINRSGPNVLQLCTPIIEVRALAYPTRTLGTFEEGKFWSMGVFSNLFKRLPPDANRWLRERRAQTSEFLYIPHLQMESIKVVADVDTLLRLYDRIVDEVGFPYPTDAEFEPRAGESIEDCVARILSPQRRAP